MRGWLLAALLALAPLTAGAQTADNPLGDANTWSTLREDALPQALQNVVPGLGDGAMLEADAVTSAKIATDAVGEDALDDALSVIQGAHVNCTVTVVGAGTCTVVAAVTGKSIVVWDAAVITIGGDAATCTSIELEDTAGTPATVASWTVAGELTENAVESILGNVPTVTAANLGAALGSGLALVMTDTGSDCTGATSFDIFVQYSVS